MPDASQANAAATNPNGYNVNDYYKGSDGAYYVWGTDGPGFKKWTGKATTIIKNGEKITPPAGAPGAPAESQETSEDPKPSGSLRYPEGLEVGKETDYVLFTFHRYKKQVGGNLKASVDFPNNSEETLFKKADDLPDQIVLNMPQEVQTEIGAEWGGKSFSFIGKYVTVAGGQLATFDYKGAASTLGNFIGESVKSGDAFEAMAAAAVVAGINKIPGVGGNLSMNDLIQGASGRILNPNVELMYEGPQLRSLSMNLKLVARTSTEAQVLRKIGRSFRKAALPSGIKSDQRFINTPSYVKIRFMRGSSDNQDVPKYKMCAITGVSVNYAPDGQYVSFAGGYLPALQLALTLQETKIIFSDDIDIESNEAQF